MFNQSLISAFAPSVSSELSSVLGEAIASVSNILQGISRDRDRFYSIFRQAFGIGLNTTIAEAIRIQWANGDFSQISVIEILDSGMNGALGAYASSNNRIYLAAALFDDNQAATLTSILLEEIGHSLDAQLNTIDTIGDEGQLFSAIVRGENLTNTQTDVLRSENDAGFITVNGQPILVEKSSQYTFSSLKPNIFVTNGSYINYLTNVNGTLFFQANDGVSGYELWKSDGTVAGTFVVKDISSGSNSSNPTYLTKVNGTLFFSTLNELWKSDGTAAGTVIVKSSFPSTFLTDVNGTLFSVATDGINGQELWKSDGTAAGTILVKDIYSGSSSSSPDKLTNVNGSLFFVANDGINGNELWKSDGTASGTVLVKDIVAGNSSSNPDKLTNVNGTLFFVVNNGVNGNELWKSDGTAAGTVLVKDILLGLGDSSPDKLTNVNGTLFFSANNGINGNELWKSDGTTAGTVLVKDIFGGSSSSSPDKLTNMNGTLFFQANNGTDGNELWKSDGTAAGTVLVKDIYSGSSRPLAN